jgi:hypothetical protein
VDLILNSIKDEKEVKEITRQQLADLVRGLFFSLTEAMIFGLLKRISHAVSAVELVPTYREILNANPTSSFKLADMSVKLDTLKLPTKEVIALSEEFQENLLCKHLLRKLVVHHIYLFPTDYKTKQQICEPLGIPIKQSRGIDVAYEEQKRLPDVKS